MIYPAVVMKVLGFPDNNGKLQKDAVDGSNIIKCLLDNGEIVDIKMYGNDKEMSSLKDYLNFKALSNVKDNKVKTIMSDISFDENNTFGNEIEKELTNISESNPAKARKMAIEQVAKNIMINNAKISQSSIIRMALAKNENGEYNSRSIISVTKDGERKYSSTGVYQHALNNNAIPIEVTRMSNNTGLSDFYEIKTSKLINTSHIKLLFDHSIRTIEKTKEKPFLPRFIFEHEIDNTLKSLLISFNNLSGKDKVVNSDEAIQKLKEIKSFVEENNLYKWIQMKLPLLIDTKTCKNGLYAVQENKGKSPFQNMRDAIVTLNFSAENPEVKHKIKEDILNISLKPIVNGEHNPKMLLTYNIVAADIFGESNSWGYMVNNVDFSKITLAIDEQNRIINYLSEHHS